ncbi:hypothetical protein PFLmoz3_00722 [Pseudomonas fluorescens]|uniref:Uncharacterized protein n=1 Tax=Pseudomonas fluorescens TaxID=294 RepID=A0A125QJ40_PSEFL|nr:hypothetical protein PFLmoz3_00722 [Pseudomonas fluorescens]
MYAVLTQVKSQLVGTFVELAVGQCVLTRLHCNGIGGSPRMGFKQRLHGQRFWVVDGGRVEVHQQSTQVARGQHLHTAQRHIRRAFQCVQQAVQRGVEVAQDRFSAHCVRGHDLEPEAAGRVVHREHQRVTEDVFTAKQGNARHKVQSRVRGGVTIVEQTVEQFRHAATTLGQRQGRLFMGEQSAQLRVSVVQRIRHVFPGQAQAQRQGVDKHAQGPLGPLAGLQAAEQHGTEHHIFAAGDTAEHLSPGQVEKARGTDPQGSGLAAQAQIERVAERALRLFGLGTQGLTLL